MVIILVRWKKIKSSFRFSPIAAELAGRQSPRRRAPEVTRDGGWAGDIVQPRSWEMSAVLLLHHLRKKRWQQQEEEGEEEDKEPPHR